MKTYLDLVFNLPIDQSFTYLVDDKTICLGHRVLAPFGKRELTGFAITVRQTPPPGIKNIKSIERLIDKKPIFDQRVIDLARWVAQRYICSLGEALSMIIPGARKEKDKDAIFVHDKTQDQDLKQKYELAPQQKEAIEKILCTRKNMFYIHGVTGSGKTDVYLNLAQKVLKQGKAIIYLVPEISLTHQIVRLFTDRFEVPFSLFHSGLSPAQRLKEWIKIFEGDVRIVIGVRSSVFAPLKNLGLIILDEEHETTYKSGFTPRYHARQIAMYRCQQENALLLLGSATPSLEAYYMIKKKRLGYVHLSRRLSGGKMPQVEIVDMKAEAGPISGRLFAEIKKTNSDGKQTILFLNRRGFSYFFQCNSCGFEVKCRNCSVPLTFHKHKNRLICHYCGYNTIPVSICPECKSTDISYHGFGTQLIEQEIKKCFPHLSIKRVDTDSVRNKTRLIKLLKDFHAGTIDILLGTQMVAKGLNFPRVTLVGIISADTGLHIPDFRAAERTFSLIVQVAGRAGRFTREGKVIIQTFHKQNEIIKLAAKANIEEYFNREIEYRKQLNFPPFSRLIRLVFRGKDKQKTFKQALRFRDFIIKDLNKYTQCLGPAECPLAMIARNHRYHLIFRTKNFLQLHSILRSRLSLFKPGHGVYMEIDVDPVSIL